jgi:hypothetical protein
MNRMNRMNRMVHSSDLQQLAKKLYLLNRMERIKKGFPYAVQAVRCRTMRFKCPQSSSSLNLIPA